MIDDGIELIDRELCGLFELDRQVCGIDGNQFPPKCGEPKEADIIRASTIHLLQLGTACERIKIWNEENTPG